MIPNFKKLLHSNEKWLLDVDGARCSFCLFKRAVSLILATGGFYTQAPDNLPLIGHAMGSLKNYWLCGALSGCVSVLITFQITPTNSRIRNHDE